MTKNGSARGGRWLRRRCAASLTVSLLAALWSAPAGAQPKGEARRTPSETQFDNSFDVYLGFGAMAVPYGGRWDLDEWNAYDPGYQWGLGLGYFLRARDKPYAVSGGLFFEHALLPKEIGRIGTSEIDHVMRLGLELRPGLVLGERVFLYAPLRGGYAGYVLDVETREVAHGLVFGVGGGIDVAVFRRWYLGTVVGADLHYFRTDDNFDLYSFAWRTHVGVRF